MSDNEPSTDPDGTDAGGGLGSFLNSAPKTIGAITGLIAAVSGLLIALNKVGILGSGDDPSPTRPTDTIEASGLFNAMTRPGGRVYFDGSTMYMKTTKPGRPLVNLANQEEALGHVSMSSRVAWVSGARDYGVGFICRYESPSSYYLLALLSGPRYNLVRYRNGKPRSLSGGIKPARALVKGENTLVATCVGDKTTTLTLQANGDTIGTAQDHDGIAGGNVGLRVGSGESFVTIRFEDFLLKYL